MQFTSVRVRNFRSIADSGEIPLGPVTLFVGRNNSGKSALLHAVYRAQEGAPGSQGDVRLDAEKFEIELTLGEWSHFISMLGNKRLDAGIVMTVAGGSHAKGSVPLTNNRTDGVRLAPAVEPQNAIFPVLATRRQQTYAEQARLDSARVVGSTDANLVSRVMALATSDIPEARAFRQACRDVLGLQLNVLLNEHGQHLLGVQVSRFTDIPVTHMGAGITSALNLLISLSSSHQKLFIIEEPENDLHPQALKALLDLIEQKSADNQFIISTHSSVVLARLGSIGGSVVVHTRSDGQTPPTSTYEVVGTPAGRIEILQDLGYELADLELGEGWLIFEESSAERLAREFLIPWFAPRLLRLRTLAASGTSRLEPIMQDFRELFLFAHLEPMYRGRAWVIADGDPTGVEAVEALRKSFPSWPNDRFLTFQEHSFEAYYPEAFHAEVAEVLAIADRKKRRERKRVLLNDVLAWIADDEERAKSALEASAREVIDKLRGIEASLLELGRIT